MPQSTPLIRIHAQHARSLVDTIDAIRGETHMLKAAGLLGVCADDLLDGGGTVNAWIASLETALVRSTGPLITLPPAEAWALQHVVYSLSAVLVWAHEMRRDGRIATVVASEALTAWAEVERTAGLGGRTSTALGWRTGVLTAPHVDVVAVDDLPVASPSAA